MIEVSPVSENQMTYDEAILYSLFFEYNGHRDWRLPTMHEYHHCIDMESFIWYQERYQMHKYPVQLVRDV